jgi:RNA polymerase sigma factor (sigma-70 family)
MSDAMLINKWRGERDAQAFSAIVKAYADMVYGTCHRIIGNPAEAEEIAQDCFLVLAEKPPRNTLYLGPWLHKVATTRALNRIKQDQRRRQRERAFADAGTDYRQEESEDIYAYVDEALNLLPEKLRAPVVLHFLEGKTQAEVGQLLGLPRTTVSTRVTKAVEQIRRRLRSRGITAGAGAIMGAVGALPTEAAPATLIATLGKVAMAGTTRTAAGVALAGTTAIIAKILAAPAIALIVAAVGYTLLNSNKATPGRENEIAASSETSIAAVTVPSAPPVAQESAPAAHAESVPIAAVEGSCAVSGRVVDETGNSVADAEVIIARGKECLVSASSGANGEFDLDAQIQQGDTICAFKSEVGLAPVEPVTVRPHLVLRPLGRISGSVQDTEGRPIPNLPLKLSPINMERSPIMDASHPLRDRVFGEREQVTDSAGRFAFSDLAPARHDFDSDLNKSSYAFPGYQDPPLMIDLKMGEKRDNVVITLKRGGAISGTVYGPDGRPLPEVGMGIVPSRHGQMRFEPTKTDANGFYRFQGLPTNAAYTVSASPENLASVSAGPIDLPEPVEITGVDFQVASGHSLSGRIIDEAGKPIAGAEVAFEGGNGRCANTGQNGDFFFQHVAPGEHRLSAFDREHSAYERFDFDFEMPADHSVTDVVITLKAKRAGTISGRVTDAEGNPLAGLRMLAFTSRRGPGEVSVQEETETDDDGRYEFHELGGATYFNVDVYPGKFAVQRLHDVEVGSTGVDLRLARLAQISGQVVDAATGKPIPEFDVRFAHSIGKEHDVESEHLSEWVSFASAEGRFKLDTIAPPSTRLEVRAQGYSHFESERIAVEPGDNIEGLRFALSKGASIAGHVIDAATGEPLSGARVRVYSPLGFHIFLCMDDREEVMQYDFSAIAMSDSEGRFELPNLNPAKPLGLVAWREGCGIVAIHSVIPGDPAAANLELSLAPEAHLTVNLSGERPSNGKILVTVVQVSPTGDAVGLWLFTGTENADADNNIEFSRLSPGQFKIQIQDYPDIYDVTTVDLAPGENKTINVDLAALSR